MRFRNCFFLSGRHHKPFFFIGQSCSVTFHAQTIATFSSNFTDEAADMRERGECPYDTEGSNTLIRICWMNY